MGQEFIKYIKVKNKFTGQLFWIHDEDLPKIGKNEKVGVFIDEPQSRSRGCQPFIGPGFRGFTCSRGIIDNDLPVKKFMGIALQVVRQKRQSDV